MGNLLPKQRLKIVLAGLDCAGKTSLIFRLRLGETVSTVTNEGLEIESVTYNNLEFVIFDLETKYQSYYQQYFENTNALIYILDSNDRNRITQNYYWIHRILHQYVNNKDVPVLIYANKQHLPTSMDIEQIKNKIGLIKLPMIDPEILYSLTTNENSLLYSLSNDLINIIYDYAQETVTGFIERKQININDLTMMDKHIGVGLNEQDIKQQNTIYQLIIDYCGPYKEEMKPQRLCKIFGCDVVASTDGVYEGLDWLSNALKTIDEKKKEKGCIIL